MRRDYRKGAHVAETASVCRCDGLSNGLENPFVCSPNKALSSDLESTLE